MKYSLCALTAAILTAAPAAAADPLSSLRFLTGTWNCSYNAGKTHVTYKAVFAYDLDNNWIRENDSWNGGGGDLAMFTYEPKRHGWTAVVVENQRTSAVFYAKGTNPNHIVYHSIYPDASMSETFDRSSPTRYAVRFKQSAHAKTVESTDTCVKT